MTDLFEDLVIVSVVFGFSILGLLTVGAIFFNFGLDTGHGSHIGYISEIENNGWIWQPTTITILNIQPTYSDKDTSWTYAVANKELEEIAKAALVNKSVVAVHYETRQITSKWEYSSRTIITGIEVEKV